MSNVELIFGETREEVLEERAYEVYDKVDDIAYDLLKLKDSLNELFSNYDEYIEDMSEEEEEKFCDDIYTKLCDLEEIYDLIKKARV